MEDPTSLNTSVPGFGLRPSRNRIRGSGTAKTLGASAMIVREEI